MRWQPHKQTMCGYCQMVLVRMPMPALISASPLSLQRNDAALAPEMIFDKRKTIGVLVHEFGLIAEHTYMYGMQLI